MNRKALTLSIPMILAVLLLGGWFLLRDWNMPKESQNPPAVGGNSPQNPEDIKPTANVDTSNWKTYRNEEYGYSLKFPASMKQADEQSFVDYSGGGFSFYLIPYERLKKKQLISISRNDLLDSSLVPFIESGNIETTFQEKQNDKVSVLLVVYAFKKEPQKHSMEAWSEGSTLEEAFFQCGLNICAIRTFSDQLSSEKRILFSTILSTLHSIK